MCCLSSNIPVQLHLVCSCSTSDAGDVCEVWVRWRKIEETKTESGHSKVETDRGKKMDNKLHPGD